MKLNMEQLEEADRVMEHEFDDPDAIACELVALRGFVRDIMACWPDGDVDGGHLQDVAVHHGLLRPETRTEPCGDACACVEYGDFPATCYRRDYMTPNKAVAGIQISWHPGKYALDLSDGGDDQMPQRLLPCPFCGAAAEWSYREWDGEGIGDDGTGSITCSNSNCGVRMFGLERDSAEEQWNHRVLPYRVE